METPELRTLKRVIERLDRASIPYMLTGSMALNFYGHQRATDDFDIVIEVQRGDDKKLFNLFRSGFYVTEEGIREALEHQRLFNILDEETIFKVDLIVRKDDGLARSQFSRRLLKEFMGLKAYVISPEDLILSKLEWSRESRSEMQERDIRNLFSVLKEKLDLSYLEKWAAVKGLLEELKSFYASK